MPNRRPIVLRVASLLLSCLMVIIGISMLRNSSIIPGLIVTVVGIALFALTSFFNEKYPPTDENLQFFKPFLIPVLIFAASLTLLSLAIVAMADFARPAATDRWITAAWIGSLICLVAGMLVAIKWRPPKWHQFTSWVVSNKKELLVLAVIVIVGAIMRTYDLTQHPYPWSGDEASVGIEGTRILKGEVTDFFAAGWSGQPNWSFVPTALSEIVFGRNILAVRMVSVIEGTLAIIFLYLLARELFGKTIAALAAGFLVTLPVHLQFSRIGVNNIIDSFTICMVLWLEFRAIRKGRWSDYLWVGIAGGLAFYTYVGSRLVLVIVCGVFAYTAMRKKDYLRLNWRNLLVFVGGAILTIAPLGFYFIHHPDIFMTRIGQESIFTNHWLSNTAKNSGQTQAAVLWKQFTDTALVYISQPAGSNFFNSPLPYLTVVGSMFFVFGMGYALLKLKDVSMMAVLGWFWSDVIIGGVLTLSPPANTRLVMSTPAVALFLALGIYYFTDIIRRMKFINQGWQTAVHAGLILFLATQNFGFYFGSYRVKDYFEDANGELGQVVGLELQHLGPNYDYYLFGLPRVFAAFPTTVFLAPNNYMVDLDTDKIDQLSLRQGKGDIFVAIPENQSDLQKIAAKFPGGNWEKFPRVNKPEILYYAYVLKPK